MDAVHEVSERLSMAITHVEVFRVRRYRKRRFSKAKVVGIDGRQRILLEGENVSRIRTDALADRPLADLYVTNVR